jgi:hypothetical protein
MDIEHYHNVDGRKIQGNSKQKEQKGQSKRLVAIMLLDETETKNAGITAQLSNQEQGHCKHI